MKMPDSRRSEALELAEELLTDIECSRLPAPDLAKRASRLARLLDDAEAVEWLRFEIGGYTGKDIGYMTTEEVAAAKRSRRVQAVNKETGEISYTVSSLASLQANADACMTALTSDTGGPSSSDVALLVENARISSRNGLIAAAGGARATIDSVIGAIHEYVSEQYQALRFGSTIESAFERLRADVDNSIGALVPNALARLNAAFENATSENPEHWANAASTCRRLLKEVADALRPPGPDVDGRKMGEDNYINRLVDWIMTQATSETVSGGAIADLEYLGRRLDAAAEAGHKGAHAEVSRFDASRFLVGTYVLLGDILRLADPEPASPSIDLQATPVVETLSGGDELQHTVEAWADGLRPNSES